MGKRILVGLCMFAISVTCIARSILVESKISEATVFKSRAMVTRTAEVNLERGKHELIFSNIPMDFIEESVRVSGEGTGDIKILDLKIETIYSSEVIGVDSQELMMKLETLQNEDQAAADRISVCETKKSFIESLKAESAKVVNLKMLSNAPTIHEWDNMLNFFDKNLTEIYNKIQDETVYRRNLANRISAISEEIDQGNVSISRTYKEVKVYVETTSQLDAKINVSYFVENASWYSIYDARISSNDEETEMIYYGMVQQSTGEDWDNVRLILSTALPMESQLLPDLKPWHLEKGDPYKVQEKAVTNKKIKKWQNLDIDPVFKTKYRKKFSLQGGKGEIVGTIKDAGTGQNLTMANIRIMGMNKSTTSDDNGQFVLGDIYAKKYSVQISFPGYETLRSVITLGSQQQIELTIGLVPSNEQMLRASAERTVVKADYTTSTRSFHGEAIEPLPEFGRGYSPKKVIRPLPSTLKVSSNFTFSTYEIPIPYSIPCDNEPHKVTIAHEPMPSMFKYVCIPKLDEKVYLKCHVANASDYTFYDGDINIFYDNDFVSKSMIQTIVPSDTFELNLGVDQGFLVKRRQIKQRTQKVGLIKSSKVITTELEIEIKNFKQKVVDIQLIDQIPISSKYAVNIELIEPDPAIAIMGPMHRIEWNLKLEPSEAKKYRSFIKLNSRRIWL